VAAAAALAAGAVVLTLGSCYRPNILPGGFGCAEAGKPCPDGFACDPSTLTCVLPSMIGDAAADRPVDAAADRITDGSTDSSEVACFMPLCASGVSSGCDPVCQTGCACQQKCSANTKGVVACSAPLPGPRRLNTDNCQISAAGTSAQTDDCAPGLVCVADHCANHCYRFCRIDADCTNATCTGDAGGGVKICSVPFTTCNPVGATATGCAGGAQGCYLSSTMVDKLFCDCPTGSVAKNQTCATTLECLPGLVCVDALGTTDLRCLEVCSIGNTCTTCSTGRFKAYLGSATYGYCY